MLWLKTTTNKLTIFTHTLPLSVKTQLMKITIDHLNSESWTVSVGEALGQQLALYNSLHEEKNFAFKLLGVIMMKSKTKDFIQKHLSVLMNSVKHTDNLEQEVGCAFCEVHF